MTTIKPTISFILPLILAALLITSCSDYDNDYTVNQIRYEKAFLDAFGEIDPAQDWNLVKQLAKQGTRIVVNPNAADSDTEAEKAGVARPKAFTENQRNMVRLYFQNNKYAKGEAYPFDDLFAQQIYYGGNRVGTQYGSAEDCTEKYLNGKGEWISPNISKLTVNGEHLQRFNKGCGYETMMYVYDLPNDLKFGYFNNENSEEGHLNFIIISGATIDAWAQAHPHILAKDNVTFDSVADRWFVGFDFEFELGESIYAGDFLEFEGEKIPYLNTNTNFYGGEGVDIKDSNQLAHMSGWSDQQKNVQYKEMLEEVRKYIALGYLPVKNSDRWVKPSNCADGYYSDWIISITPGKPGAKEVTITLESALLICEDLGSQDFDFNDIVLKLEHKRTITPADEQNASQSIDNLVITSMAAGGTLPAYVYYKPLRQESIDRNSDEYNDSLWTWIDYATDIDNDEMSNGVHHMWQGEKDDILTPLNVGQDFEREGHSWSIDITDAIKLIETSNVTAAEAGKGYAISEYVNNYVSYVFDFARIRIYIGEDRIEGKQGQVYVEPIYHGIDSENGSAYKSSNIPQMILVPESFEWPTETTPIATAYANFRDWVRKSTNTYWFYPPVSDNLVTSRNGSGGWNSGSDNDNSETGEYKEVQVKNEVQQSWEHTTCTVSPSSPLGNDYPYGAWIKVVFSEAPSNLTLYANNNIGQWTVNSKEFVFELTDANMKNLIYNSLVLDFNLRDEISVYIKPKTAEEAFGKEVSYTKNGNEYTIPSSVFADYDSNVTVTFVDKTTGNNFEVKAGNEIIRGSSWWAYSNDGFLSYTLTSAQLSAAKQNGLTLTAKDGSLTSDFKVYIKSSASAKRRTTRR